MCEEIELICPACNEYEFVTIDFLGGRPARCLNCRAIVLSENYRIANIFLILAFTIIPILSLFIGHMGDILFFIYLIVLILAVKLMLEVRKKTLTGLILQKRD